MFSFASQFIHVLICNIVCIAFPFLIDTISQSVVTCQDVGMDSNFMHHGYNRLFPCFMVKILPLGSIDALFASTPLAIITNTGTFAKASNRDFSFFRVQGRNDSNH